MKVTKIRDLKGNKVNEFLVVDVANYIQSEIDKAGFISHASATGPTSMHIGIHMGSFRIDPNMLGYNARLNNNWQKSPKGYKRTSVPTWEQRVEFNHIINNAFDKFKLKARIMSGEYLVRSFETGRKNSWSTLEPYYAPEIETETDARKYCNSDELELQHAIKVAEERKQKAKLRRQKIKAFEASAKVILAGFSNWPKPSKLNGKQVTHYKFSQILLKLTSRWELKRVKAASIDATVQS